MARMLCAWSHLLLNAASLPLLPPVSFGAGSWTVSPHPFSLTFLDYKDLLHISLYGLVFPTYTRLFGLTDFCFPSITPVCFHTKTFPLFL